MNDGPDPGQRTDLEGRGLLLGRDPTCDLVINDVEVSRRHARLIAQSGGYAIEDLGSTNGTFIDGERIDGVVSLKSGASIRFGDRVSFVYEEVPADEAGTMSVPVKQEKPSTTPHYMPVPRYPTPPPPPVYMPEPAPPEMLQPAPAAAQEPALAPVRRRPRRKGIRLPLFTQRWMMIGAVLLILGACAAIFFFWYVDANYLWCDVFGGLISACR